MEISLQLENGLGQIDREIFRERYLWRDVSHLATVVLSAKALVYVKAV